ncbi:MAG: ABC transporter substrate-binding protein [Desulfovibrionaceae bacterium]|nr:ABC transporter substrate-binding protein [Desulfovibrionaceae bacterium]
MRFIFSLVLSLFAVLASTAHADDFTVLAAPYPPYSESKGLKVCGTSISALNVIMEMCGNPLSDRAFKLTPWAYAYENAARFPGRIVVNARRTSVTEPLYKWVGPVVNSRIVLYGRKQDGQDIRLKSDLKQYRIATVRWSSAEGILLDNGFSKAELLRAATHVRPLRMLDQGEIDLFATDERCAAVQFAGLGMNPGDYVIRHVFKEEPLYFAFSRDTDDRLIGRLNKALSDLKAAGRDGASRFDRMMFARSALENRKTGRTN